MKHHSPSAVLFSNMSSFWCTAYCCCSRYKTGVFFFGNILVEPWVSLRMFRAAQHVWGVCGSFLVVVPAPWEAASHLCWLDPRRTPRSHSSDSRSSKSQPRSSFRCHENTVKGAARSGGSNEDSNHHPIANVIRIIRRITIIDHRWNAMF